MGAESCVVRGLHGAVGRHGLWLKHVCVCVCALLWLAWAVPTEEDLSWASYKIHILRSKSNASHLFPLKLQPLGRVQ